METDGVERDHMETDGAEKDGTETDGIEMDGVGHDLSSGAGNAVASQSEQLYFRVEMALDERQASVFNYTKR